MNRNLWGLVAASFAFTLGVAACSSAAEPSAVPTSTLSPTPTAPPGVERAPRFTDEDEGYTVRFTPDYNVVTYGTSACFTLAEGVEMVCHVANAFVDVTDPGGQTLAEAADAAAALANPDIEVQRSEIVVGGEPAVLLDDIYSYDVLRKVVVIHGDRLYVLTFVPWSQTAEDFARVQALYDEVTSTLEFLP